MLEQAETYPLVWFVDDDSMGAGLINKKFLYTEAPLELFHVQKRLNDAAPKDRHDDAALKDQHS